MSRSRLRVIRWGILYGVTAVFAVSCGQPKEPAAPAPIPPPPVTTTPDEFSWERHAGKTITILMAEHPVTNAMRDVVPEFEELTGMTVTIDALAEDLYFDRMEFALRAPRGMADVYFLPMDSDAYKQWSDDLVQPLTPYLEDPAMTHEDYDLADFPDAFLDAATYPPGQEDAQLYGIPVSFEAYILFYNKAHVDEYLDGNVPKTMDELTAAAQRIAEESEGEVMGAVMRGFRSDTIVDTVTGMVFNRWGPDPAPLPYNVWFDGAWTKPRVTHPAIVAGLNDYAGMMNGGPSNIQAMDWPEATLLFSQGRAAFFIDASLFGPGFEDESKSQVAGQVGYAELPPPEPNGTSRTGHWMWGIGIPKNAANPDAAWHFIQWFTGKDIAAQVGAYHGGAPRLSTWDEPEYTQELPNQYVDTVNSAMTKSRSTVVLRQGWKAYALEIAEAIQKIHSGADPQEAAENLQQRFESLAHR